MRWYSFFVGYLIILVEGRFPEKVINMALSRGIFLWDIYQAGTHKYTLKVRLYSFRALARVIRNCGCRFKIVEKKGFPFGFSRLKKRKILALGSIFFLLTIYILSSFIWIVDVQGTEDLSIKEIKELAAGFGIKPGAVIKKLDFDDLEKKMQESHPQIAWIEIDAQGTKITIEIVEKVLIPKTDDTKVAHLIAAQSGTIEEMLVLLGTPLVKEGDIVQKGQLLIAGYVYPELELQEDGTYLPGGNPEIVRAKGVVRARVSKTSKASCPIKEIKYIPTGNMVEQVYLRVKNREIVLKGPKQPPFTFYQKDTKCKSINLWRNIKVPVEIITNIYFEQNKVINNYGYEGAYLEAVKRGEKKLKSKLTAGSKILQKTAEILPGANKEVIAVKVNWECLENIAIPRLITTATGDS